MALASRSGGPLPPLATAAPLWARPGDAGEEPWEGRQAAVLRGEVRGYARLPVARNIPGLDLRPGAAPAAASEHREAGSADWRRELAAGGPIPPTLQRLRTVLLRLHREREQLLQARDCARHLQASVRLLRTLSTGAPSLGSGPVSQLCRDLRLHAPGGARRRIGLRDTLEPVLLARAIGLAAQRLDAAIEIQLVAVGRAPASPSLSSRLADLLQSLPTYHGLQGKALSHVPGAARPFPTARVLRLLTEERGCQMARRLEGALLRSGLKDQLRRQCQEERELLPGLLGLVGGVAGAAGSALGLGGAGTLWSQYWTLLWAACAQSLDLNLGPWRDLKVVAKQLDQVLGQASLPQECEKELASWCHSLRRQSLIGSWDQGFCQALGSALGDPSSLPGASHTAQLLQQLFPPLLHALQQPESGPLCGQLPALCTLQTTLLWLLGRAQRHLAAWAPGAFLLLIQKDLPPLLREVEALSRLTSEGTSGLEAEQQLNLEMHRLATRIQLLPEESLGLFSEACHKQATKGFKLHMPRGRYWRPRLSSELPSVPSEYAGLVVRTVLEPVLQGLRGLSPQAQAPALGPALTATLRAWLDHILTCGIRFSLQGALQLRQDFGVVRELLEEEQWGLSPDVRQSLFMLSIFQQLDGAILCLLQQPLPKTRVGRRRPCCCTCTDVQTTELPSSCLNSLDSLEPSLRPGTLSAQTAQLLSSLRGGGPSPEAYLVGNQQAWLALRQHQDSRWHLTFLACLGINPES
ncbi:coiled-coil domain-containing protein 142 isoform X2 [Ochotona curzoniae]|uniref:coiled-coil domain-containing protein 142 isoform X2 n=1 Tax=Ochotona curzoniae TaxID=130825 RepID=UPI001B34C77D|nr:coiled-coil domain-containing protein 142 isoform X2 [Ochotona curzoniae]